MASGDLSAATESLRDTVRAGILPGTVLRWDPFVSHGPAPEDCCEQVNVRLVSVEQGNTTGGAIRGGTEHRLRRGQSQMFATWEVKLGDCYSMSAEPVARETLEAQALAIMEQAWAVYNAVQTAIMDDSLFGGHCRAASVNDLTPLDPSGGCASYVFEVRAQIDGYRVDLA